jgi:hypothetical protein
MYAGGADEIAEHSQETADKMQMVLMRLLNTADKINVCRWC